MPRVVELLQTLGVDISKRQVMRILTATNDVFVAEAREAYRAAPDPRRKAELKARFNRIFKRRIGFATLDRLLARLHANRAELLRVLDRPEIPLHTNGSENDIRCQAIRRKVSGAT